MPEGTDRIGVTLVLRRPERTIAAGAARAEVQEALSAEPADLEMVRRFCAEHGLGIDRESAVERSVRVSGGRGEMGAVFSGGVPAELRGAVIAVLGLEPGPVAKAHWLT
jgi:hypothetical protein